MTDDSTADLFGFADTDQLSRATRGMLLHLQRLGISHLDGTPNAHLSDQLALRLGPPQESPAVDAAPARAPRSVSERVSPERLLPERAEPRIREPLTATPTGAREAAGTRGRMPQVPQSRFAAAPVVDDGPQTYTLPVLADDQRRERLDTMAAEVRGCQRCPELAYTRKNTVFGDGSVRPRVVFFGEAPGADEDRLGKPFVGRAGQLLTKMIEACTLDRQDCYIFNSIKCRPPGNRNPQLEEVENCRGYFENQLEILQPEYIVCLGLVAARALLRSTASVGRLRGVFHRYRSSKVLVTYHPAYLLRNPEAKRAAWDDLQIMLGDMGIDPRTPRRG